MGFPLFFAKFYKNRKMGLFLEFRKTAKKIPGYCCFEAVYKISSTYDKQFGRKYGSTDEWDDDDDDDGDDDDEPCPGA